MAFGDKLKKLREEFNWTQHDLSKKINISQPTIHAYEHNLKMPRPEVIVKISEIFNVTTDYLLGIDNDSLTKDERLDKITKENPLLSDKKKLDFVKSLSEEDAEYVLAELKRRFPHKS